MNKTFLLALLIGLSFLCSNTAQAATTYYVRPDGGTAAQCTGTTDAKYPGSGTGQACAFNHPYWALSPIGSNPNKLAGGDTLIIDGSNNAAYMMGYGAPNIVDGTVCAANWPWDCYMRPIPSGPSAAQPTRILGKGYDSGCANSPELWGTERVDRILNLQSSNNVQVQCLEITDHSDCQEFGPKACNRDNAPYGTWASKGLVASDSANVLIKNVNIHGMGHHGVHAARLKDWTIEDSKIVANSFVGWDGDMGATTSSNSGTITFTRVTIAYNGCGETYPGLKPYNCYSQDQGGYGDGLGTHKTEGNWVFNNVDISHNVSDGLDLLYHTGSGTTTIKRSRFEGNAGNQAKVSGNAVIENSIFIGNCSYFKNNPYTWQTSTFNNCRAGGNPIHSVLENGQTATITNSAITSNGDTIITSKGASCNGTEKITSRNNIYLGSTDFNQSYEASSLYYAAGANGNGDGPCGATKFDDNYSIIYGTKFLATDCAGKPNSKCVDPKLVEPIVPYYTGAAYNVNLQSISPAINAGLEITGGSALDFNSFDRGASWDIGALDYGSKTGTTTVSLCGNGILNTGEVCDGLNLNLQTCLTKGYISGSLSCNSDCTFNISGCTSTTVNKCGNGVFDTGEQCDGTNLNGQTCVSKGYDGGTLSCTSSCLLNVAGCTTKNPCGNGTFDSGEQCDGTNLNGQTCVSKGFTGGTLSCTSACMLNTSACTTGKCGNGVLDSGEQCDGSKLNSQTCASKGFAAGTLSCTSSCTFNTALCTNNVCGNGTINTGEQCDGSNLNGQSCISKGFSGGTLSCTSGCVLNTANCTVNKCGNGTFDSGEQCDGVNLNGQTCASKGFGVGQLSCDSDCMLDTSGCSQCGDGQFDDGEQCDGTNLNGQTCLSKGFISGSLSCNSNCTLNTTKCKNW